MRLRPGGRQRWDADVVGDPSEWVAAIAAIAAACVVAWQSWETRRSAEAAEKAVAAADRAVVTAQEGLELSRQQTSEAVRARIDANTPNITVHAPDEPTWPPLEPSQYLGGEPQPLPIGPMTEPMLMPRDRGRLIMVVTPVEIINESDRHVTVETGELFDAKGAPLPASSRLAPDEHLEARFAVTRTLEAWIDVHLEREGGRPGADAVGWVRYGDPADTGAIDRWEVVLTGCPVEHVQEVAGWRLIAAPARMSGLPGAMGVGPVLKERFYYLSKRRNEKLPD